MNLSPEACLTGEKSFLLLTYLHASKEQKYIYKDISQGYVLLPKESQKESLEGRITFRDLTLLGLQFKEWMQTTSETDFHRLLPSVCPTFKNICIHKLIKDESKNLFIRILFLICDCIHNLFSGLGFKSTLCIALELHDEMAQKIKEQPVSIPAPKPTKTTPLSKPIPASKHYSSPHKRSPTSPTVIIPKEEFLSPVKERRHLWETMDSNRFTPPASPLERKITRNISPHNTRKKYEIDPSNCDEVDKISVFKTIEKENDVYDLIKKRTGKEEIDLKDPISQQVIKDVIEIGKKELVSNVLESLSSNPTANLIFLKNCFEATLKRGESRGINNSEMLIAIEILFKMYNELYLNKNIIQKYLTVNDPVIVTNFCILLENKPYDDDKIRAYLSKMMDIAEFNISTFIRYIDVYIKKERDNHNSNIVNLTRNLLIKTYFTKVSLQNALQTHTRYVEINEFLSRYLSRDQEGVMPLTY